MLVVGGLGGAVDLDILDYLIHNFGRWGRILVVYSLGEGPKGPTLVRFHVIKIKKIFCV